MVLGGEGQGDGSSPPTAAIAAADSRADEDPLKIGGLIYLRSQFNGLQGESPAEWQVTAPYLVDGFLDARPNSRVRGFLLVRLQGDPTVHDIYGGSVNANTPGVLAAPGTPANKRVAADQVWIRFDVEHRVFVTAGIQHVRWGTARLWTPADVLHEQRRNPLDVFDSRTGSAMLKLHLPWEQRSWNFYAYAISENAGPTLKEMAAAARAEVVLGTSEFGAGVLIKGHRKPRFAADWSVALWDFDLYGEMALFYGSETDRVWNDTEAGNLPPDPTINPIDRRFPVYRVPGVQPQVTGGLSYTLQYAERDTLTIGGEYFFNDQGYSDPSVYPGLVFPRGKSLEDAATLFYLGRHYAGLFVVAPQPFSWDLTTFTFSTLANLSDRSFVSRLDYSVDVLTHLRFEAFVSAAYGRSNGEFRFGINQLQLAEGVVVSKAPNLMTIGLALRLAL